jgi:nitrate/nitrite transporter NarK
MDASIYAVVLVPALTELLPRSGIAATPANTGYYGSVLLALFLFGWGLSMVWGPVADRFGRVRALMLTILCYSLFGLGGANFAMYTLWIPEQYATECRGSAIGFTSSIGRFGGCAMVFLVGAGIAYFKMLGTPVTLTSIAFLLGLLLLPLGEETRGRTLPV